MNRAATGRPEALEAILVQTLGRNAHASKNSTVEIRAAVEMVDDTSTERILEHRIDREIPPSGILDFGSECTDSMASIEVAAVTTGRDLEGCPPRLTSITPNDSPTLMA